MIGKEELKLMTVFYDTACDSPCAIDHRKVHFFFVNGLPFNDTYDIK